MTEPLFDEDREESCSFAISSLNFSCSVIPIPIPLVGVEPFSPGTPGAERDALGIDFEMSRPMGFLRLMADLALPNGDDDTEDGLEGESVEGESSEMGLGGAARRVEASGGVWSVIAVVEVEGLRDGDGQKLKGTA